MSAFSLLPVFAISNSVEIGLPVTFALAAIALIGYLFGNRTRAIKAAFDERRQQEMDRAAQDCLAVGNNRDAVATGSRYASFAAGDV